MKEGLKTTYDINLYLTSLFNRLPSLKNILTILFNRTPY